MYGFSPVLKEVDPSVAKEASDEKRNYIDGYGSLKRKQTTSTTTACLALAESIAVHPEGNFLVEDTISGIKSILCLDNSGRATSRLMGYSCPANHSLFRRQFDCSRQLASPMESQ